VERWRGALNLERVEKNAVRTRVRLCCRHLKLRQRTGRREHHRSRLPIHIADCVVHGSHYVQKFAAIHVDGGKSRRKTSKIRIPRVSETQPVLSAGNRADVRRDNAGFITLDINPFLSFVSGASVAIQCWREDIDVILLHVPSVNVRAGGKGYSVSGILKPVLHHNTVSSSHTITQCRIASAVLRQEHSCSLRTDQ